MSSAICKEDVMNPKTLHEAINIIKFLKTTHKNEMNKMKEYIDKQKAIIHKLEANRKKELDFLSGELQQYEIGLALRTENVKRQLAEKDDIIQNQAITIEELSKKLKSQDLIVPDIIIDSNSDSGVAMENDESCSKGTLTKSEVKAARKCSRRFADPISFLRKVDFSPMKYKQTSRDNAKKKDEKKYHLDVPIMKRVFTRQFSNDRPVSDDDRSVDDSIFSDGGMEPLVVRPNKLSDSMINHLTDDESDETSEEIFERVITRSSVRRSVKANPKYKKINRTKPKLMSETVSNIKS